MDELCVTGLGDYNVLMCGIFKQSLSAAANELFAANGWDVKTLKRNPY
jgi:hypothetical protein